MVTVTLESGQRADFKADAIIRVRKTRPPEADTGRTRIDWIEPEYVMEDADVIAEQVRRESTHPEQWVQLQSPKLGPVWFRGPKSAGPITMSKSMKTNGIQSGLMIGSLIQYVSNSPQEVTAVISAAGGIPVIITAPTELDTEDA